MKDTLVAFVGKPSSGKSTTLNALSEASAKVGSHPFTTIEPNKGVGFLQVPCACKRFNLQSSCRPLYGTCKDGQRAIPIQLLDVAGLIPGAHEGKGLGNKFLDNLRVANALVHVVDASGCTDMEGKECRGYDPSQDVRWLREEIVQWIYGNLISKWGSIKRRHVATKSSAVESLNNQFSGYGSRPEMLQRTMDLLAFNSEEGKLESWNDETVERMVNVFVDVRFPTVIVLNKIDHQDSDQNISKIAKKQHPDDLVLASSITEVFLRKLSKQNYIRYEEGTEFVDTKDDLPDSDLKEMDEKNKNRIETIRDMVLYRYGSTGVTQILQRAIAKLHLIPVYIVSNTNSFRHNEKHDGVFRDVLLFKEGRRIGDIGPLLHGGEPIFIETVGGVRVSQDDLLQKGVTDILHFKYK